MSDTQLPRKRPFWQLHLSTAVLLMLIAGVFLGFNVHTMTFPGTQSGNYSHPDADDVFERRGEFEWVFLGWPWPFWGEARWSNSGQVIPRMTGTVFRGNEGLALGLDYSSLLCDLFVWAVLLALAAIIVEWRIRGYPRLYRPKLHTYSQIVALCAVIIVLWINLGRLLPSAYGMGWPQPFYYGIGSQPESSGWHAGNLLFDIAFGLTMAAALTGIAEVALRRRSRYTEAGTRIRFTSIGIATAMVALWILAAATPGIAFFSYENWVIPPPIYGFPFPTGTSPDGATVKWLILPSIVDGIALICGIILVIGISEAIIHGREARKR